MILHICAKDGLNFLAFCEFTLSLCFQLSDTITKENIGTEYRIGLKSLHDLYPSKVNEKINADSKLKTWDSKHKLAVAEQSRRIHQFEAANAASTSYSLQFWLYLILYHQIFSDQNLPLADKLIKEDLDNGLECLQSFEKQYSDVKTTFDCILYQTKDGWRCVIDVANVSFSELKSR